MIFSRLLQLRRYESSSTVVPRGLRLLGKRALGPKRKKEEQRRARAPKKETDASYSLSSRFFWKGVRSPEKSSILKKKKKTPLLYRAGGKVKEKS
jgi:Arc/MetJ-type ribon-helix-helix transcriptional regulator